MPNSFSGIGGWKIQDSELREVSAHFVQDNSGAYVLGTMEGTTNTAEGGQTFIAGIFNSAAQATIFGTFNSAKNYGAVFGSQNIASGGMVQGSSNTADDSFVFGYQNSGKKCSFIQGDHNTAFDYSTCYGYNNTANNSAFTHGYANEASGYSFAAGRDVSSVNTSLAHGFYSKANNMSLAQGHSNTAIEDSLAQGQQNFASGNSFAQGFSNHSEDHSMTQGRFNTAYYYSQAFGHNNIMSGENSGGMVIGQYNKTSSDVAFVIGNGAGDNARSDAFIVELDGTASATKFATSGIPDVEEAIKNIAAINTYEIVNGTSTADITDPSTKTIYLIEDTTVTGDDVYEEWICTNTATPTFVMIGDTTVDLSNYVNVSSTVSFTADSGVALTETSNLITVSLDQNTYNMLTELSGVLDDSARSGVSGNTCVLGLSGNILTWLPIGVQ